MTSSAKKRREPGSSKISQTPDGSFYDLQRNAWHLLQQCGMGMLPELGSVEQYLARGPGFIALFHPALGPVWEVIAQKIRGGALRQGGELVLEVRRSRMGGGRAFVFRVPCSGLCSGVLRAMRKCECAGKCERQVWRGIGDLWQGLLIVLLQTV